MATPRTSTSQQARVRRRRPSGAKPFYLTLLVAATIAGAWFAYEAYCDRHLTLVFANGAKTVPSLKLTFFPDQLAFAAPSPPPALGEQQIEADGGASIVVGSDLVPGHAVVRYRGQGIGTGIAHIRLGKPMSPIQLRPPQTLSGRVGEPLAYWCMGWRCAGFRPIADAEVTVMGGGEHGIDLATARTDAEGKFTVEGFDGELNALGIRVRAKGFGIEHEQLVELGDHEGQRALIAVTAVPPRSGRIEFGDGVKVEPSSLRVLARGLPGVEAVPTEDGLFTLDHIPRDLEARVVIYGLPDNCAQAPARTIESAVVRVAVVAGAIVEGCVLDHELNPVAGALVWIGDAPAVRTDQSGRYRLVRMLPGLVDVTAQMQRGKGRRARKLLGTRSTELVGNKHHSNIDITLNR